MTSDLQPIVWKSWCFGFYWWFQCFRLLGLKNIGKPTFLQGWQQKHWCYSIVEATVFLFSKIVIPKYCHVISVLFLLFLLHCTAVQVQVHTILVFGSAVNAAVLLQFDTIIPLYSLEYLFRQLVATVAHLSDLVDIPQYCLYDRVFPTFLVDV